MYKKGKWSVLVVKYCYVSDKLADESKNSLQCFSCSTMVGSYEGISDWEKLSSGTDAVGWMVVTSVQVGFEQFDHWVICIYVC